MRWTWKLWIITDYENEQTGSDSSCAKFSAEEFMTPHGLLQNALARALGVAACAGSTEIVLGEARHHGGHGVAAGAVFQHDGGTVDGLAGGL